MKILRDAVIQAVIVAAAGFAVAFAHNAASKNGINPLKRPAPAPIVADTARADTSGIRIVGLDVARAFVDGKRAIVDARTKEEYDLGHLPGARSLPYYEMTARLGEALEGLTADTEILLYCSGPTCDDSEMLGRELYALGFKRLLLFRGGYEEWMAGGLPVEGGAVQDE